MRMRRAGEGGDKLRDIERATLVRDVGMRAHVELRRARESVPEWRRPCAGGGEVSAGDVTAEMIATWREIAIAPREVGGIPEIHPLLDALEDSRAEGAALRRQVEEQQVVVPEPPEEKELYDTLGDEECEASYEAVSHYLMGWRHCSESIRPPLPGYVVVGREEWETMHEFLSEWALLQWADDPRGDGDPAPHRKRIDELFERLDALRSGEAGKEAPHA